jgi:hypothetical protein
MNKQTDMKSTLRSPDYKVFTMMNSFSGNTGPVSGADPYSPPHQNKRA